MKPRKNEPTQEQLRQAFVDDGINLVWNVSRKGAKFGQVAGSMSGDGYWQVWFNGTNWKAHRLLWIFRNGPIPEGHYIDHIDGCRTNNSAENLRLCSPAQNMGNLKNRRSNKTGVKGVHQNAAGKFVAAMRILGRSTHLGTFDTLEEASARVEAVRALVHGEFSNHG